MPDTFPANDLQRPERLHALLGSFWLDQYAGQAQIRAFCEAAGEALQQTWQNVRELEQLAGRETCPIWHTDRWLKVTLLESELGSQPMTFGDGHAFGIYTAGGQPLFGSGDVSHYAFTSPDIVSVQIITNRITDPSRTLLNGIDFRLEHGLLVFRENPFDSAEEFQVQTVFTDGAAADRELTLWLWRSQQDWTYLQDHWAYLLGLDLPSVPAAREVFNAEYDAITGGTALEQIARLLQAATGIPLALSDEIVEDITLDSDGLLIITDRRIYRYAADATALVAIGDAVVAGQALVDTLQIYQLNQGVLPTDVRAIAAGPGLLGPGYLGELVFHNEDTALIVESDLEGNTRVSFALSGFPLDVEAFWDAVHAQGLARGQTLAWLLDTRAGTPTSEPTAESLPATINPAQFLVENVLRNNALLVTVNATALGVSALGTQWLRRLRYLVPAQSLLLTILTLPLTDGSGIIGNASDELDNAPAMEPLESAFTATSPDTLLRPRLVSGSYL